MPQINAAGLALIQNFEGCELTAYPDPGSGGDPWTIGFGHTGSDVHPGSSITQTRADELLLQDLAVFERCVNDAVSHSITPNQFAACVSFAYNEGCGAFEGSTLLRLLNAGDVRGAADQFGEWVSADGRVLEGLVRRRAAERALFLTL